MNEPSLRLTLQATGASPLEVMTALWQTQDPGLMEAALQEAEAWLRKSATSGYRTKNNGSSYSHLPEIIASLLEADPDFGNAAFARCQGLAVSPILKFCSGNIGLGALKRLSTLPDGLHVKDIFRIEKIPGIRALPANLEADTLLSVHGCENLSVTPAHFKIRGSLVISECPAFATLGEGLRVGRERDVTIRRCSSFTTIGPGLECGNLYIDACPKWDGVIPKDAKIRGVIGWGSRPDVRLAEWREIWGREAGE